MRITDREVYDDWLASAEIPYDLLIPLLHQMNGSENIYREFIHQRNGLCEKIPNACRQLLQKGSGQDKLNARKECLEEHQISSLTILDEQYPPILREIADPPGILFFQGNRDCLRKTKIAAMVGSRAASYAGLKAAKKIATELSRNKVTVISGLAYGIDAACHQGCLEGGSPTIAVMGCGLDQTYPLGNETLKKDILLRGGLVLSEYATGSKPVGYHFPYRNRIISGLADAVILMEARIRSGSMTTIDHALRQGKEIYAYPGDPTSPLSEGNRSLLRDGARFFTEANDILTDMDWLDNPTQVEQNSGCSPRFDTGNASESAVYRSLLRGALGFDELIESTGLEPSELMCTLTVLQIKKAIDLLPGKKYQIRQE